MKTIRSWLRRYTHLHNDLGCLCRKLLKDPAISISLVSSIDDVIEVLNQRDGTSGDEFTAAYNKWKRIFPEEKEVIKEVKEEKEELAKYYDTLGLELTATREQIKDKFRSLVKESHPDKTKSSDDEKIKAVIDAYDALLRKNKESEE